MPLVSAALPPTQFKPPPPPTTPYAHFLSVHVCARVFVCVRVRVCVQALMEVMEEEELDRLRDHQREFEELRRAELLETQRLEEQRYYIIHTIYPIYPIHFI